MAVADSGAFRNLVLRPEAVKSLADLRLTLALGVRKRRYTADAAFAAYQDGLVQTLRRRDSYLAVDDERYIRVKCRQCGRPQGALKGDDAVTATTTYVCLCSPTTPRDAFMDEVGIDDNYLLDLKIAEKTGF